MKIDDQFAEHPKVIAVGPGAAWLYIKALCWSSRQLTDGFIPEAVARHLVGPESADQGRDDSPWRWPNLLVEVGLWENAKGGYKIHDYLAYNPSKSEVLTKRTTDRRRKVRQDSSRSPTGIQPESSPFPSPSPSRSPEEQRQEKAVGTEPTGTAPAQPLGPPGQGETPGGRPEEENGIPDWFRDALTASQNFQSLATGYAKFWQAMTTAYDPYEWLKWDEEVQKADAWIAANPQRAPTTRGRPRFLRNWFERTVERQRREQRAKTPK